ncbi:hypothetical protein ABZ746_38530 [Streptomyces sp. NPDC020096]
MTADQVQRLALPHLSFKYTHLPESKRKSARNKSHRNVAGDLVTHRQVVEAGFTEGGGKLWQLTSAGLEAAARVLDRPEDEMGGRACGAGTTGAVHAMAVNETILAFIQPKPDLAKLVKEPEDVLAAARSVPAGVGSITSWSTEVSLPPTGSWYAPGKGGAQAEAGPPAAGPKPRKPSARPRSPTPSASPAVSCAVGAPDKRTPLCARVLLTVRTSRCPR